MVGSCFKEFAVLPSGLGSTSLGLVLRVLYAEWLASSRFGIYLIKHMGGCQNYGPLLGALNIRCRITIGISKKDHNVDNHPYVYMYSSVTRKVNSEETKILSSRGV